MQAYKIDPFRRTVDRIEIEPGLHALQRAVGNTIDIARFATNGDGVVVDDEALLRDPQAFFTIVGYPQPLAGIGIVLGCDSDGESIAPRTPFEEVVHRVQWWAPDQIRA